MALSNPVALASRKPRRSRVEVVPEPEESLRLALRDFQEVLSPEQKHIFTQSGVPDPRAVIVLTTEIDKENAKRRSRCVAARISSFLESVQQFSSIVDTFIQSNPKIAALVWGGVKVALLVGSMAVYPRDCIS